MDSNIKTYKPSKKTLEKIKNGETLLKHKDVNEFFNHLSPVGEDSDPFTMFPLEKLWKALLPFNKDQVSRMEPTMREEIIRLSIEGILNTFKEKVEIFLSKHVFLEMNEDEHKLKYLIEYGTEADILNAREYDLLLKYFEDLVVESSQCIFKKTNYVIIAPEYENWELVSISEKQSDELISKFHHKCLNVFRDFSFHPLQAMETDWFKYLKRGLTQEEKVKYKDLKLKPLLYFILGHIQFVEGNRLPSGETLDRLIILLENWKTLAEIEDRESLAIVKEYYFRVRSRFNNSKSLTVDIEKRNQLLNLIEKNLNQ